MPVIGVLLLCGWCTAMLVIGLLLRYGQSAEILAWATTFVLLAVSGVFNPVESLPAAIQPIAKILPTTYAFGAAATCSTVADPVGRPAAGRPRRLRARGPVDALRDAHAAHLPRPRLRHALLLTGHGIDPQRLPTATSVALRPRPRRRPLAAHRGGVSLTWCRARASGSSDSRSWRGGVAATALARRADQVAQAVAPPATTTVTARPTTTTTAAPHREATLAFGGDILIHSGAWDAADTGTGYDFSPMLAPIAPRLTAADLAICHLEVTLARPGEALSSYPRSARPRRSPATWPRPASMAARWRRPRARLR